MAKKLKEQAKALDIRYGGNPCRVGVGGGRRGSAASARKEPNCWRSSVSLSSGEEEEEEGEEESKAGTGQQLSKEDEEEEQLNRTLAEMKAQEVADLKR